MRGYIALTAVLVVIPLLLLTGIDTLYRNISMLSVGKMNYDYQLLKANSETCIEEGVYRLKRNPTLVGDINITGTNWSCVVNVVDESSAVKILTISVWDSNGVQVVVKKKLDMNPSPFELSNIQ